jgi:hypothetical protein
MQKLLEFGCCSTFVCIWQLVSNHGLIWLKKILLVIYNQTVQLVIFLSIFNVPYIYQRFDVMGRKVKI